MKLKNLRVIQLFVVVFASAFLATAMTGCTHQKAETPPADLAAVTITLGKPAFPFDPAQTISLNIAKADPVSGETWSARVEKKENVWKISSFSGDSNLSDRLANKAWILHFLETLNTFRADSALSETDSTHYGFSPPRYAVEWRTSDEAGKTSTYQLRIGTPVDISQSTDGESFALFPPHEEIYQAGGAALVMLRYLKSFSSLRLETLSTIESGDVTEIDLSSSSGKKHIHSKFDGKKWIGADVTTLAPFLTHLRIQTFIDKPSTQPFVPMLTIVLTNKDKHVSTLTFNDQDLAKNSDRGDAVFQMYPGSVAKLGGF